MNKTVIQTQYENELPEVKDWSKVNYSDVQKILNPNPEIQELLKKLMEVE